jgi:hypothetical protein
MAHNNSTTKWVLAIALLIVAILMAHQFQLFSVTGITTSSKRTLYINEPVNFAIQLQYGNLTASSNGSTIDTTQADVVLTTNDIHIKMNSQDINATITEVVPNLVYNITVPNPVEGYLSVTVQDRILMMELKAPVVNIEYDIPIQTVKGAKHTLFVRTMTPQGDILNADSVMLEIVDPHTQTTVEQMKKVSDGVFSYDMTYTYDHNYYFTITPAATSLNYKTTQRQATTVVQGSEAPPIFFYFMIANVVIFVIVLIVKNFKKIRGLF